MNISCPGCAAGTPFSDVDLGPEGCMMRCARCGTTWLARRFADNPYRQEMQLRPVVASDVTDAVVIEQETDGEPAAERRARAHRFAEAARRGANALPPRWRESPRSRHRHPGRRSLMTFGGLLAALVLFMVLQAPIVSAFPDLAGMSPDMRALEFNEVRSETLAVSGTRTLTVEGNVVNRSARTVALPAIRVSLHAPGGGEVASWLVEPTATDIGPGKTIGFRSALASPPADATQVTLNLTGRSAEVIGLR